MMIRTSRILAAAAVATVAASIVVGTATAAHADTTRYASPDGAGSDCTVGAPCLIDEAINQAEPGDIVILATGTYGTADAPLAPAFTPPLSVAITGADSTQPPVIYSASGFNLQSGDSLHSVTVSGAAAPMLVTHAGSFAQAVTVIGSSASGLSATCVSDGGPIADSVCEATGDAGVALETVLPDENGPVEQNSTISGDTLIASGATSSGLLVKAGQFATVTVKATNTIAQGTSSDVGVQVDSTGTASLKIDHSDFSTKQTVGGANATISRGAGNIATAPKFRNAAASDFRERKKSPTVNAGGTVASGDTDLAGNPRTIGAAADIGAYELPIKPTVKKFTIKTIATTTAAATAKVNAEGLTTSARLVATKGKKATKGKPVTVGAANSPKKATLSIKGLKRHTTYTLSIVATNAGGATTVNHKLKTK